VKAFCLGYTHQKCDVCQKQANWNILNQMPNALRLAIQKTLESVNTDKCRLTKMGEFAPMYAS